MEQQNARSEAINAKVQKRIDEIRAREEVQNKKREEVRLYQVTMQEQEAKDIEPKLAQCYNKLTMTAEKANQLKTERAI